MASTTRNALRATACCLLLYCGTYAALSLIGGYEFYKTGRTITLVLPTPDIWLWQPRFGFYDPYYHQSDALGMVFRPLIVLDQKYWHLARPWYRKEADGSLAQLPLPPNELQHPRVKQRMAILSKHWSQLREAEKKRDPQRLDQIFSEIETEMAAVY